MKAKFRIIVSSVATLAVLFVLALSIALTSAYYTDSREAIGCLKLKSGIVLDYSGFGDNASQNLWGADASLKLFELDSVSVLPGQKIDVATASVGANASSVGFYTRVKLGYRFYKEIVAADGAASYSEISITDEDARKNIIDQSKNFFSSNFVSSDDGWNYYSSDSTSISSLSHTDGLKNLFATGATVNIGTFGYLEADTNKAQSGGFKYNGEEIKKIEVYLVVDTLQNSATPSTEGWEITARQLYQIDENGVYSPTADYLLQYPNQTFKFTISDLDNSATIVGIASSVENLEIPASVTINNKAYAIKNASGLTDSSLKSITVATDNQYFSSDNGVLFNKGKTKLIRIPDGTSLTSYSVPSTITEVSTDVSNSACVIDYTSNSKITTFSGKAIKIKSTQLDNATSSNCEKLYLTLVDNASLNKVSVTFTNISSCELDFVQTTCKYGYSYPTIFYNELINPKSETLFGTLFEFLLNLLKSTSNSSVSVVGLNANLLEACLTDCDVDLTSACVATYIKELGTIGKYVTTGNTNAPTYNPCNGRINSDEQQLLTEFVKYFGRYNDFTLSN